MFSYEFVQKLNYGDEFLYFGTITQIIPNENKVITDIGVALFEEGKDTFDITFHNSDQHYTVSNCSLMLNSNGLFNTSECNIAVGDEVVYNDEQGILIGIGYFNITTREFNKTKSRLSDAYCALIELPNEDTIAVMKSNLLISWNSYNFNTAEFKICKTDLAATKLEAIQCYLQVVHNYEF